MMLVPNLKESLAELARRKESNKLKRRGKNTCTDFSRREKESPLTQAELGARIGADKAYISKVERGLTVPSVSTFYKIAAAMGLTVQLRPAL